MEPVSHQPEGWDENPIIKVSPEFQPNKSAKETLIQTLGFIIVCIGGCLLIAGGFVFRGYIKISVTPRIDAQKQEIAVENEDVSPIIGQTPEDKERDSFLEIIGGLLAMVLGFLICAIGGALFFRSRRHFTEAIEGGI